ncbi:acyltransferase family protein [Agromyces humatus]|uniref:Acyltransferase 3 domain-containing protein n=1 Tax=Agromyces humatus TaxID=279573 RepID=A0ABN2KXK7_9MICO|nr:acyltransferase family protein [Agromyces humatus]
MVKHVLHRDASIDVLRIVAIVAIVVGHVWFEPPVRLATYTWHVPIFFVLSGYLASSLGFGELVRRRGQSLLLPYLAWLVIIAAILVGFDDPLRLLAGGAQLPRELNAFWFVTAFFVAIVAAAAIERLRLGWQWLIAAGLLTAAYLTSEVIALVPLDAGVGLACVVFVVAGRTLRDMQSRIGHPATTGAAMLAVSAALIVSGASGPLDLKHGDFGTPVVSVVTAMLISGGLILVVGELLAGIDGRAGEFISRLSLCGFMVVLTHSAVLFVMREAGVHEWGSFGVALVGPWLLAMLLLFTPLSLALCGVPRRAVAPRAAEKPAPHGIGPPRHSFSSD